MLTGEHFSLIARATRDYPGVKVFDATSLRKVVPEAISDFAVQLHDQRLLRMPFPHCLVAFGDPVLFIQVLAQQASLERDAAGEVEGVIIGAPGGEAEVLVIVLNATNDTGKMLSPIGFVLHPPSQVTGPIPASRNNSLIPVAEMDIVQNTVEILYLFISALMSPGVRSIRNGPTERRVARNIAQGRDPGVVYHTITISPEHRAAAAAAGPRGERASPRMHWRRGHFRHTTRGGEPALVPIPPTIVGSAENGIIDASYLIKPRLNA